MTVARQEVATECRDVLLLHGWGLHGGVWGELTNGLRSRARLLQPDLPGHGSNRNSVQATLDNWVRTFAEGRAPAIWIGWSLGALLALRAATLVPASVHALILIAATPRFVQSADWPYAMAPEALSQFAAGLGSDYVRTLSRFIALQFGSSAAERDAARCLRDTMSAQPPTPEGLAVGLTILKDTDLRATLPSIKVPVLVIHGEHDRLASPTAGAYIADHVPRGEFVLIHGAGHAPFLSHRDDTQCHIENFLDHHA